LGKAAYDVAYPFQQQEGMSDSLSDEVGDLLDDDLAKLGSPVFPSAIEL